MIQASRLGELDHAGLRANGFRMGRDRAAIAEQATRHVAGGRPPGAERHLLGVAHGRAMAGVAEGVRPVDDLLQPFCAWRALILGGSMGMKISRIYLPLSLYFRQKRMKKFVDLFNVKDAHR